MAPYAELPDKPCDTTGFAHAFVRIDPLSASIDEVRGWCRAEFGETFERARRAEVRWFGYTVIWIRDRTDAMLFKIRWC